jgi:hypothetical protein
MEAISEMVKHELIRLLAFSFSEIYLTNDISNPKSESIDIKDIADITDDAMPIFSAE